MEIPLPMLAKAVPEIPAGNFAFEPKWDGFRAIVRKEKGEVEISSRGAKWLTRYFPELVSQFAEQLSDGTMLDGEVIVVQGSRLDFGALQQRIHPADSRVQLLARTTPASYVAFDLLERDHTSLLDRPFHERRQNLESLVLKPPLSITALTDDHRIAEQWFESIEGAGLDGVVAKSWDMTYQPDARAMLKIKHHRSADCVVGGYRPHKNDANAVGALLLGLYDQEGVLQYVGSTSSFTWPVRLEMAEILAPLIVDAAHPWLDQSVDDQRIPGAISRWSSNRERGFVALDPVLVCEVRYDQLEGDRFRHTTTFLRWRPDREASECNYEQLEIPAAYDLSLFLRWREG